MLKKTFLLCVTSVMSVSCLMIDSDTCCCFFILLGRFLQDIEFIHVPVLWVFNFWWHMYIATVSLILGQYNGSISDQCMHSLFYIHIWCTLSTFTYCDRFIFWSLWHLYDISAFSVFLIRIWLGFGNPNEPW